MKPPERTGGRTGTAKLLPSVEDVVAISAARIAALDALAAVRAGAPADDAVASASTSVADPARDKADADRGLAQEIVYGVLRWRRRIDAVIAARSSAGALPKDAAVLDILRVGTHSLLFLDRVPPHAAVSTAVEAAKRRGSEHASKFVNAVLRSVGRDAAALRAESAPPPDAPRRTRAIWHSFPEWMMDALAPVAMSGAPQDSTDSSKEALLDGLLAAMNRPAPLCLRATPRAGSRDGLLEKLRAGGIVANASRFARDGIVIPDPKGPPTRLPGFDAGEFAIQDEAAQLVTELLDPSPGDSLLDVCAAPGGKAIHAAQRGATVVGLDADPHRLDRVRDAAGRLGVHVELFAEEIADRPIAALGDRVFPKVLVDAPCSGTGIVRRKPDVKWARKPEDVPRLAARQLAILSGASRHVAPDGVLVYAVCSLLTAEGEAVAAAFLAAHGGDFRPLDIAELPCGASLSAFRTPSGHFRSSPLQHGTDGFFAATFRRNP